MEKFFIQIFSSVFPTWKSHWETDDIGNQTHKIKIWALWISFPHQHFRPVLPELNPWLPWQLSFSHKQFLALTILTYLPLHFSPGLTKKSELHRCTLVFPELSPPLPALEPSQAVLRPGRTTEHSGQNLWEGSRPRLGTTVGATHNYSDWNNYFLIILTANCQLQKMSKVIWTACYSECTW